MNNGIKPNTTVLKKKGSCEPMNQNKSILCNENVPEGIQICSHGSKEINKVMLHAEICSDMTDLYERKNHDYGDSFAKLRNEVPNAILVRLYDKYNRLKTLMSGVEAKVKDESIDDTLMDLANYCILELIERKCDRESE